jgi:hypothetical protein
LAILTGSLRTFFGAGANLVAGFVVLTLGFVGGRFNAVILGARDRGFLEERRAVRRLLDDLPGRLRVTGGKSEKPPERDTGARFTKRRETGILRGGAKISPGRLGRVNLPPCDRPMPLSTRTLKSTKTWFVESHGLN